MLRVSQVCSALRFFSLCSKKARSGLRPPAPQRWANARLAHKKRLGKK